MVDTSFLCLHRPRSLSNDVNKSNLLCIGTGNTIQSTEFTWNYVNIPYLPRYRRCSPTPYVVTTVRFIVRLSQGEPHQSTRASNTPTPGKFLIREYPSAAYAPFNSFAVPTMIWLVSINMTEIAGYLCSHTPSKILGLIDMVQQRQIKVARNALGVRSLTFECIFASISPYQNRPDAYLPDSAKAESRQCESQFCKVTFGAHLSQIYRPRGIVAIVLWLVQEFSRLRI